MSLFHYIGSSKELPLGERGRRKSSADKSSGKLTKAIRFRSAHLPEGAIPLEQIVDLSHIQEDEIEVYDSMEDAAGIYIQDLGTWNGEIRGHFTNPFVYQIAANWGGFSVHPNLKENFPEQYKAHVKCIRELFDLMKEYGSDHEQFELYTCWDGEEKQRKNEKLHKIIDLKIFQLGDEFELKDKQYILIKT